MRLKFFPRAGSTLGGSPMTVLSQAQAVDPAHPADREYVENVMWEQSGVLFVTVDVPGGSNNDTDPWYGAPSQSAAQQREVANRTGADLRWLSAAFAKAKADGMSAMVIDWQADVWDLDGKPPAHLSQYDQFVNAAADGTTAFGRPVLMFNGDSHAYKSDNPLAASDPAKCPASGPRRGELPPRGRARQHRAARISPAVDRHRAGQPGQRDVVRTVQLGARRAVAAGSGNRDRDGGAHAVRPGFEGRGAAVALRDGPD